MGHSHHTFHVVNDLEHKKLRLQLVSENKPPCAFIVHLESCDETVRFDLTSVTFDNRFGLTIPSFTRPWLSIETISN
jgi:hypothetical protein